MRASERENREILRLRHAGIQDMWRLTFPSKRVYGYLSESPITVDISSIAYYNSQQYEATN